MTYLGEKGCFIVVEHAVITIGFPTNSITLHNNNGLKKKQESYGQIENFRGGG